MTPPTRISSRKNKGVAPKRYTPSSTQLTQSQRTSSSSNPTSPSSPADMSDDELDKTIKNSERGLEFNQQPGGSGSIDLVAALQRTNQKLEELLRQNEFLAAQNKEYEQQIGRTSQETAANLQAQNNAIVSTAARESTSNNSRRSSISSDFAGFNTESFSAHPASHLLPAPLQESTRVSAQTTQSFSLQASIASTPIALVNSTAIGLNATNVYPPFLPSVMSSYQQISAPPLTSSSIGPIYSYGQQQGNLVQPQPTMNVISSASAYGQRQGNPVQSQPNMNAISSASAHGQYHGNPVQPQPIMNVISSSSAYGQYHGNPVQPQPIMNAINSASAYGHRQGYPVQPHPNTDSIGSVYYDHQQGYPIPPQPNMDSIGSAYYGRHQGHLVSAFQPIANQTNPSTFMGQYQGHLISSSQSTVTPVGPARVSQHQWNPCSGSQPTTAYPVAASHSTVNPYIHFRNQYSENFVHPVTVPHQISTSGRQYPGVPIAYPHQSISFPQAEVNSLPLNNVAVLQPQWNPMDNRPLDYRRNHELPTFSGRPEEWPLFNATFIETTQMYGYTDRENLVRLRKSLTGVAIKTVEAMLIHPHNVRSAMEILETHFGQPEHLVRSQLDKIRELPIVDEAHLDKLTQHSMVIENLATYLDTAATQHHLSNPFLLDELLAKIPMSRRLDWTAVASRIQPYPTLRDYAAWITSQARLVNLAIRSTSTRYAPASQSRPNTSKPPINREKHVFLVKKSENLVCNFCEEDHDIHNCKSLLRLTGPHRLREITKLQLCYGCLGNDHLLPTCDNKQRCGVEGCPMWHTPILHQSSSQAKPKFMSTRPHTPTSRSSGNTGNQPSPQPDFHPPPSSNGGTSTILNCQEGRAESTLLFRVVPVTLFGPHKQIKTFALLDEGSAVSLIDRELADELQLEGITSELSVQWFGKQSTVVQSRSVSLSISGEQSNAQKFAVRNLRTIDNLVLPIQSVDREMIIKSNSHLQDIPFGSYERARPKILVGLDNHHLGTPRQTRTNREEDGIVAAETKIGWVIYGSDGQSTLPGAVIMHISVTQDSDHDQYAQLHELVREHFTTENFGVTVPSSRIESDEIIRARHILDITTQRVGNRFETGLLWRNDTTSLPDSYGMALRRLSSIEAKMRQDPAYGRQYREQIDAYVSKGYARKLTRKEADTLSNKTWYLPHFAVRNVNKPGKFRLVFDAAASATGVSLNSVLLSGPDMNVPLTRLLFQFRLGAVGVCGDIREMFHQVMMKKEDQDAQRFLWRNGDASVRPDVYVMQVMTFGATCSPASAQHVKNVNAAEFANEKPEAADAIQRHHYVDDFVASFATPKEAVRITEEVIDLHQRGGFELRSIVSNSEQVRKRFGTAETSDAIMLEPDSSTEKILGMSWDTADDTFRFKTRFNRVQEEVVDGRKTPTKREVLSTTMSIFDPFGLLADFVLASKLILQDLWRLGVEWDDPVPEAINERWQSWRSQIPKTQLVRVPRCYSLHLQTTPDLQLHIFADASEVAFAAVAYWRVQVGDQVELAFIAGKARCAPIKLLSIPRLELQAAVLAARLMVEICESHDLKISRTVFWSDSETVLKWLRSDQRKYKAFVAFRVAEILEIAPVSWWRWVPTALNVADDATRVRLPLQFEPNGRWTRGPEWLHEKEEHWPVQTNSTKVEDVEEEVRSKFIGILSCRGPVEFKRFSKFSRLCRSIAWANRFVANARNHNRNHRLSGELSAAELSRAVDILCRWVQNEGFPAEMADLQSGRFVAQGSQLFILKPYLDTEGLMRVHGRTDEADERYLQREAKRPILLPGDHPFTRLLVHHHHERLAHQLTDATISAVRERYWVPRLRTLVRQVQHECLICVLRKAKPSIPSQGQLPKDRMDAYARPFTNTGLDYFGPVTVTVGRRHEKRWVALFTCLTVRAVHLEIAADMTTDACLMCIRNLCNLRGVPSLIRCDNGTNFIGARNELARESNFFDPHAIQRDLSTRGVEWRFNCPANPEAGGAWERLVQSVKRVLSVTLHEEAPRVETLRALLLEAANMINSRPLTHLQVDPNDPEPLTPNHFLLGGPNVAMVPNPADIEPRATRKQWQICRGLSRTFWRQWVRDYLPEMTRRSKHYPQQPPLRPGDLVIICDENQSRSKWLRGRIEEAVTGLDGVVRSATIRTKDGTLRRPMTKLARLMEGPSPTESTDGGRDVANSS